MQDLWHSCTMLEKGAFKGCNAWYAMNNNMGVTTIGSWINFQACPTMRLSKFQIHYEKQLAQNRCQEEMGSFEIASKLEQSRKPGFPVEALSEAARMRVVESRY